MHKHKKEQGRQDQVFKEIENLKKKPEKPWFHKYLRHVTNSF